MQRSERRTPSWLGGYAERRSGNLSYLRNLRAIEPLITHCQQQKIFYTPTGAWHGKIYGMAWPYFFPLDAVHRPHTVQKDMNIKKYYKISKNKSVFILL